MDTEENEEEDKYMAREEKEKIKKQGGKSRYVKRVKRADIENKHHGESRGDRESRKTKRKKKIRIQNKDKKKERPGESKEKREE